MEFGTKELEAMARLGLSRDDVTLAVEVAKHGHVEAQRAMIRVVDSVPPHLKIFVALCLNGLMLDTCLAGRKTEEEYFKGD